MSVRLSLLCEWVYYLCEFYFELRWIVHILIDDLYVWTMRGVGSVGTYFLWSFTVNCDTLWDPEGPEFCCDVFPKPCPFPAAIPCFICPFAQIPFFFLKTILFYLQVFGEGTDAVKKSLEGIFDDTVPDGKVKIHACSFWSRSRAWT